MHTKGRLGRPKAWTSNSPSSQHSWPALLLSTPALRHAFWGALRGACLLLLLLGTVIFVRVIIKVGVCGQPF